MSTRRAANMAALFSFCHLNGFSLLRLETCTGYHRFFPNFHVTNSYICMVYVFIYTLCVYIYVYIHRYRTVADVCLGILLKYAVYYTNELPFPNQSVTNSLHQFLVNKSSEIPPSIMSTVIHQSPHRRNISWKNVSSGYEDPQGTVETGENRCTAYFTSIPGKFFWLNRIQGNTILVQSILCKCSFSGHWYGLTKLKW